MGIVLVCLEEYGAFGGFASVAEAGLTGPPVMTSRVKKVRAKGALSAQMDGWSLSWPPVGSMEEEHA
jgi:hypothetical protein